MPQANAPRLLRRPLQRCARPPGLYVLPCPHLRAETEAAGRKVAPQKGAKFHWRAGGKEKKAPCGARASPTR